MPLCKNCPANLKKRYSGKEPSPKGLGYCGGCASVGQKMIGNDGNLWVANMRKNGSVYWKKQPSSRVTKKRRKPRNQKEPTNAELRAMCKQKGIKGYSGKNKAWLKRNCLKETKRKQKKQTKKKKEPTNAELRAMCKQKGIKGYSGKNKAWLKRNCLKGTTKRKTTIKKRPGSQKRPVPQSGELNKYYIPKSQMPTKNKVYMMVDNGGRPFKAFVNKNMITVYTFKDEQADLPNNKLIYDKLALKIKNFKGYWPARTLGEGGKQYHGNTLLIKLSDKEYIKIGEDIYKFKTKKPILDFVSPVGNSEITYPVAFTEDNVLFLYLGYISVLKREGDMKKVVDINNLENITMDDMDIVYSILSKRSRTPQLPIKVLVSRRY